MGGILKLSDLDSLTIFILGGILKLSDMDSLTIFIFGVGGYSETELQNRGYSDKFHFAGGILKLSDLDSLTIFIFGGILKLSDMDSLTIFIFGVGGYSETELQNRGYSENFGPKFQPLQQAHASQIVSHILRMWRLNRHLSLVQSFSFLCL